MSKTARTASALALLLLAGLVPAIRRIVLRGVYLLAMGHLAQFQDYLLSFGRWAPTVSVVLMVIEAVAVPVPVTLVMVANGLVFGVWRGMLISFIGGFAGAAAAYAIGRWLGRAVAERFVPGPILISADRFMIRHGGLAVVLARWAPGIPCDPISYTAGITRMPGVTFLALTAVGLAPANFVSALLGAEAAHDLPSRYWVVGLSLVVALAFARKFVSGRRKRQSSLVDTADAP